MSERPKLGEEKVTSGAKKVVSDFHRAIVDEVATAVARDKVVVVGMAQNPVVRDCRKYLDQKGVKYTYIEHGSYLSKWKERLSIKLWAGFPTFPMVFIDGALVGGLSEVRALDAEGKLLK